MAFQFWAAYLAPRLRDDRITPRWLALCATTSMALLDNLHQLSLVTTSL